MELTKQEKGIVYEHLYHGYPTAYIARILCLSQRRIQQILQSVRKKMPELFEKPKPYRRPKTVRYQSFMDDQVKERF